MINTNLLVLLAAFLFGASAPIAKLFLSNIDPIPLASFLYLGSGLGLLFTKLIMQSKDKPLLTEAKITANDLPWLIGAILSGGVAAPIILLVSLKNTPASTTSLLLNFESVATTVIAILIFREHVTKRIWSAVSLITLASILLTWDSSNAWGFSLGAIGVVAACLFWGIDNNLTRNISLKDPVTIVILKGFFAGTFSLLVSLVLQHPLPKFEYVISALILGFFSYGLSIVLFIVGLRELGSARTSTIFGISPFIGAILSFLIFRELPNQLFIVTIPILLLGTYLLLEEKHDHYHIHHELVHEHKHIHNDDHHDHSHDEDLAPATIHSHIHRHTNLAHEHNHKPDIHHRHQHV